MKSAGSSESSQPNSFLHLSFSTQSFSLHDFSFHSKMTGSSAEKLNHNNENSDTKHWRLAIFLFLTYSLEHCDIILFHKKVQALHLPVFKIVLPSLSKQVHMSSKAFHMKTTIEFTCKKKKCRITKCKSLVVSLMSFVVYLHLLKTGSLDDAIREFWLAKPSWVISHYTMIYKHGKHMRDFLGLLIFIVV